MHNQKQFRITADGDVYRGRFEPFENLGHIGSILHPNNRSNTAIQVRTWWNALLASGNPIEEYVPPGKKPEDDNGNGRHYDEPQSSKTASKARRTTNPRIRIRGSALVVTSEIAGELLTELVEVW
ncbi:MAG TPA: hypothetical protein VE422_30875 [Terriglobia bacterium]|nr:hypothetical protein [Terriglobia bacterium]